MKAANTGSASSQGGSRSTRASFTYGKLDTIATASSTTEPICNATGASGTSSVPSARTAAARVVGTPQKNRPSLGETLNRASRIAAHTATSAHAGTITAAGAEPASHAYTTTGAAMPNEHMSASESICAPNGLA